METTCLLQYNYLHDIKQRKITKHFILPEYITVYYLTDKASPF